MSEGASIISFSIYAMSKEILKAYEFRIFPDSRQIEYFEKCFSCVRKVYNLMLEDRINYYKETGKPLHNNYSMYLEYYPYLKEVEAQALSQAYVDLNKAYANFFRDPKVGFPKFKSKHKDKASYRNCMPSKHFVNGNKFKLTNIGLVRYDHHQEIPENAIIKNYTVRKSKTGKYFISVLVYQEYEEIESTGCIVGIDLGIKDLVITSDGKKFDNPKTFNKYSKKLAKEQRRLSKMKKGSSNYTKQKLEVSKVYEKISNIRKDTLHKISNELISDNQTIISENLKVSNMIKNHKLAKAIQDCSWSMLTAMIQYKAEWNDRTYLKIDTFFPSSKTCSNCRYKLPKLDLDVREWDCPSCGQHHDRDINAAVNIREEGLRILNS